MAPGITATPNNPQAFISLTTTGLGALSAVSVTRNNPDGSTDPVRSAASVQTGGATTLAFFDYEAPLDQAVTFTLTPTPDTSVDVPVLNGSFETDTSNWAGGATTLTGTGATLTRITTDHYVGVAACQVVCSGSVGSQGATQTFTGLQATTKYVVGAWIKWVSGRPVKLRLRDNTNSVAGTDSISVSTNVWTYVEAYVTTGATGSVTLVLAAVTDTTAGATTFYLDNVLKHSQTSDNPVVSSPVTIVTDGVTYWLKNVSQETLSTKVTVAGMSTVTRGARILATNQVLGRANPVVISDVRSGRTGSMSISTADVASANALRLALSTGDALLLQCPASTNFPDMYFVAGDVQENWIGSAGSLVRTFEVPFIEVDSPTDDLISSGANSWTQVTSFGTWTNLKNKRTTWLDVLNRPFTTGDA